MTQLSPAPVSRPNPLMAVATKIGPAWGALSGVLAGYYNPNDAGAERTYFLTLGIASIVVAVALALLAPWIKKNMMGVR